MGIKYGVYKTPVPGDREDKGAYHARFIATTRTTIERLSMLVSSGTSFSEGEIGSMLSAFVSVFQLELREGITVELEGIGTFYPVLTSRVDINEKGEEVLKVQVKTVGFRCSKKLKQKVQYTSFKKEKSLRMVRLTPEESKRNIVNELKDKISITTKDICDLNHYSKKRALEDIHELLEEGKIIQAGSGRNTLYIKPYGQPLGE